MSDITWLVIGIALSGPLWVLGTLYVTRRARQRAVRRAARRVHDHAHARAENRQVHVQEQLIELGQLAGGLAHEIKNPLSTIHVNLTLLAEDLSRGPQPPDARMLRRLGAVQTEAARLKDILDDFLRFAGRMELTRETVDLRRAVQELTDFFAPQADAARVVLRTQLPEQPVRVSVDVNLIKQALLNLMINALQAMPEGGELMLKISTSPAASRDDCCVEVIDTGTGIAPENLPRIFQVYYSTKTQGTGLGLATTQRILREHGGTITVQSEPDKGTRFLVQLPLVEADKPVANSQ
ncbi:MAG: ATP-binding protein [Phycisphaerae bacterium]|nr:ATP-binding protein [Phycisphaerae bacterium]